MITLLISGGQTGADMGGLLAATSLGIPTGGYAPKDFRTETGPNLALRDVYGLSELGSTHDYEPRTEANVKMASATVIFGRRSRGSNLTERLCKLHHKPCLWVLVLNTLGWESTQIPRFKLWMARHEPVILNVAGNRESVNPGIRDFVDTFLRQAL